MSSIIGIDSTVFIIVTGIVIAICIAAGLVITKIRADKRARLRALIEDPYHIPLHVQKVLVNTTGVSPKQAIHTSPPHPAAIDCIEGMTDLSESLAALAKKYSLDEITLATADGLVLASSQSSPSADAIAGYCGAYNENPEARVPGIMLFGMVHKGSDLIGIAKMRGQALLEPGPEFICETKDILNTWI
jgi:hypothetical protein